MQDIHATGATGDVLVYGRWKESDETALRAMLAAGHRIADIAKVLKRPEHGIRNRMHALGLKRAKPERPATRRLYSAAANVLPDSHDTQRSRFAGIKPSPEDVVTQ